MNKLHINNERYFFFLALAYKNITYLANVSIKKLQRKMVELVCIRLKGKIIVQSKN